MGRYGGFTMPVGEGKASQEFASLHQAAIYKLVTGDYDSRTQMIASSIQAVALGLCDVADALRGRDAESDVQTPHSPP